MFCLESSLSGRGLPQQFSCLLCSSVVTWSRPDTRLRPTLTLSGPHVEWTTSTCNSLAFSSSLRAKKLQSELLSPAMYSLPFLVATVKVAHGPLSPPGWFSNGLLHPCYSNTAWTTLHAACTLIVQWNAGEAGCYFLQLDWDVLAAWWCNLMSLQECLEILNGPYEVDMQTKIQIVWTD